MRAAWICFFMAVACLSTFVESTKAEGPVQKWNATAVLEGGDRPKDCGVSKPSPFLVELEGNALRITISGSPFKYELKSSLNADGSGKVRAMNWKNQEVTFDIAAGAGPREIRFTPPYSVCVWIWSPVLTKSDIR